MSRAQTPTTPKANNNNTTTNHIASPSQAASAPSSFSGRLSPSANPDLPRRSSSLRPSSPEASNSNSKTDDASMQHPEDRTGDEDGLDGEGREEEGREDDGGGGGGMNSMEDAKEEIEAFDWEGLEGRFWDRMEECRKVEEGIREEFAGLIQVFNAWATAGSVGEEDRAAKRLRTRMAFVQQNEETLEEKRLHYLKVVKAFESALALLSAA